MAQQEYDRKHSPHLVSFVIDRRHTVKANSHSYRCIFLLNFVHSLTFFCIFLWLFATCFNQETTLFLQVDWGLFSLMSLPTILIPFLVWFRSHSKYENFKAKKN